MAADLALILAIDGSASVNMEYFGLIAGGTAAALRDPDIAAALISGPNRASEVALVLWSGAAEQDVLLDWTRLTSPADVAALADAVDNMPRSIPAGLTAIGAALTVCENLIARLPTRPTRRIVDLAGDGRNNDGPATEPVRDRLVAAGVTINGLCVLHEEPDLRAFYQTAVIGGPSAFALTCPTYAAFADAMRQKLYRESLLVS